MSSALGDAQDGEQIEGDSDYESSSDGQRAGRFYGPDSSWRYYTQSERALAASIQQTLNNDLSIALYDVHAMKARTRGAESVSAARPWHNKRRWIQPDQTGEVPFQPPPKWTAWPLRPTAVPRTREAWGSAAPHPDEEADTYSKTEMWKPSLNLQEELKAGFLRQAKDRFNSRQWEDESLHDLRSGSASQEHSGDSASESDLERATSIVNDTESEPAAPRPPGVLTDDDVASKILQPTVRHIVSKQDDLLFALHQSRRGHRTDHSFTTRAKQRDSSRTGNAKTRARKRKRVISDAVELEASSPEHREAANANPKAHRTPRGQYIRLPGQRDWSEVLGVAAMAGWEQAIIDRAARRCAALFGEGMSMRFMRDDLANRVPDKIVEYAPDMMPSVDTSAETAIETLGEEIANVCPHVSCERHREPYEKRWRLREHLKKAHKYSAKELQDWKMQATQRGRRNTPIVLQSSGDKRDEETDRNKDTETLGATFESDRVAFLQPITLRIGRSRDKRPRESASGMRPKKAAVMKTAGDKVVGGGSGSAMSTDSEL